MSTGLPSVTLLKCLRSSGRFQGRPPSRPMTPLSATATTSAMRTLMSRLQLHLCCQYDHAALGHAKEFDCLGIASLHPGEQAAAQALVTAARSRCHQMPAQKKRAVLPEQLQSARAALLECLADIRSLHETKARRDG